MSLMLLVPIFEEEAGLFFYPNFSSFFLLCTTGSCIGFSISVFPSLHCILDSRSFIQFQLDILFFFFVSQFGNQFITLHAFLLFLHWFLHIAFIYLIIVNSISHHILYDPFFFFFGLLYIYTAAFK